MKTLEVDVLEDLSIFGGLDYEALYLEVTFGGVFYHVEADVLILEVWLLLGFEFELGDLFIY